MNHEASIAGTSMMLCMASAGVAGFMLWLRLVDAGDYGHAHARTVVEGVAIAAAMTAIYHAFWVAVTMTGGLSSPLLPHRGWLASVAALGCVGTAYALSSLRSAWQISKTRWWAYAVTFYLGAFALGFGLV